jgi:hypothetical protein
VLPSWLDYDALKYTTSGVTVGLVLAAIIVLVLVRRLAWRVWTIVVLLALAGGTFYYRTTLDDCIKTCSCKFINDPVPTPGCRNVVVDEDRQNEFQ